MKTSKPCASSVTCPMTEATTASADASEKNMINPQKSHSMNNPVNPENLVKSRFKIVVEAPGASFAREFSTIKALSQYKRRNPNIRSASYTLHNGAWERFVIHGSQVIPESVLRSLLNSLNSSNSLSMKTVIHHKSKSNEAPQPSSTNHLPHNPIN